MAFQLASEAFQNGERIPPKYSADGDDVSPPLQWKEAPKGTRAYALICDDPDAPAGTWVHWVLYGIPGDAEQLPEAIEPQRELSNGSRQGVNDFKKIGYGGPAPPPGKPHRYFFKLYALDHPLKLEAGLNKAKLLEAMQGHILAEAQLVGTYAR